MGCLNFRVETVHFSVSLSGGLVMPLPVRGFIRVEQQIVKNDNDKGGKQGIEKSAHIDS